MAERDRRKKASDVFRDRNFVFAQKTDFESAFPQIKDVSVVATESNYGSEKPRYWSPDTGEYIDCSNWVCFNGGVSVGKCLRQMVRERTEEGEFTEMCQGYEGSPKGRRKYRSCMHMFTLRIRIAYHDDVHA